jgi:hypothetical protein
MDEICKITGYLEDLEFTPKAKTAYLKALKSHGNQSKAAHDLGISYRTVQTHLAKDPVFRDGYAETLLEMRHKIEGELYKKGLERGGSKEAKMWLEAHFPEDFGKKLPAKPKKVPDALSNLMDKA